MPTNEVSYTKDTVDSLLAAINASLAQKAAISSLAAVATSGAYSDLLGSPVLAAVATLGTYASLTGKPTIPATAADVGAVPTTRTVNGHALSANVTVTASDVGATPQVLATGGSAVRDVGWGTVLPTSGVSVGDRFNKVT